MKSPSAYHHPTLRTQKPLQIIGLILLCLAFQPLKGQTEQLFFGKYWHFYTPATEASWGIPRLDKPYFDHNCARRSSYFSSFAVLPHILAKKGEISYGTNGILPKCKRFPLVDPAVYKDSTIAALAVAPPQITARILVNGKEGAKELHFGDVVQVVMTADFSHLSDDQRNRIRFRPFVQLYQPPHGFHCFPFFHYQGLMEVKNGTEASHTFTVNSEMTKYIGGYDNHISVHPVFEIQYASGVVHATLQLEDCPRQAVNLIQYKPE